MLTVFDLALDVATHGSEKPRCAIEPHYEVPLLNIDSSLFSDVNCYDRLFVNAVTSDGKSFLGFTFGIYPNRKVMDATFCISADGVQRSVRARKHIPCVRNVDNLPDFVQGSVEGTHTVTVGVITLEVVEPLKKCRINVEDAGKSVTASLEFTAFSQAVFEPL